MDMALEDISSLLDGIKKTLKVKKRLQRARNKPSSKLWYDQSCKELRYKATILALFIKEKPKGQHLVTQFKLTQKKIQTKIENEEKKLPKYECRESL